ncbi:MAG TPA: hypothetical protein PKO33_15495, partial [Pyrinomonadaceae bacterium]|nr:hypothetical protein [Pyrinomonadaceae bacterium]
ATPAATNSPDAPKVVSFDFVIRCAYSPKAAQGTNPTTAAAQPGPAGPQANPTPQQVAKN